MNQFNFIGEIRPIKDSSGFQGYEEREFEASGWRTKKIRFNVLAGDNSHLVELSGGSFVNESKNIIYTFSKSESGGKAVKAQIPWSKRFDEDVVDSVVQWKKIIIDLNAPGALKAAQDDEDEDAILACKKRRKEFLSAVDAIDHIRALINSDKIKGKKFRVQGNVVYSYSAKNDQFYRAFEVTRIYLAADDAEPSSDVTLDLFFGSDCVDSSKYEEDKKHTVSAFVQFYDNNTFKSNIFAPVSLVISGEGGDIAEKRALGLVKKFQRVEGDEIRKIGVACCALNGAQRIRITEDMLSEEQRENILFGLCTFDDVVREMGGHIVGQKVQEIRITGLARGYSGGSVETAYVMGDMSLPVIECEDACNADDFDIFDDDDII